MTGPVPLKPLPYPFEALEPALSRSSVEAHYALQARYSQTANSLYFKSHAGRFSAENGRLFQFNKNGAVLHELYWASFTPGGCDPSPWLERELRTFDGILHRDLRDAAMEIQGSGWACLSVSRNRDLLVHEVKDHDYPWDGYMPLLVLDVWEHAYYLDYTSERQRYVESMLPLIDWGRVEARLRGQK